MLRIYASGNRRSENEGFELGARVLVSGVQDVAGGGYIGGYEMGGWWGGW